MNLGINHLGKRYKGNVWGLREFSLSIDSGILGLLGPNGAGKSTLMRILATVTKPTEGEASWDGHDIARSPENVRRILGYLPQDFGIYPNLNAVEFLSYLAAARDLTGQSARRRIGQLLDLVNLGEARKRRLGSLSGGMKQRVGIAQALLNDPELLIVDEPTAGLDPEERIRFRNLLSELSVNRIVILSSHIVSDLEAAATSIAIINKGRLLVHATPEELLRSVVGKVWEVVIASSDLTDLKQTHIVGSTTRTIEGVRVRVVGKGAPAASAQQVTPTLEDAYLWLLNEHGRGRQDG
ncbi:MAG: ABC transporter ATP-binding protein [candidate division Zixibacteria bacterium HGW-Zixibacteria-1]|nr:MAG: ABC transporter ATP-binding protein [candidate division Zixibacteria bacterium HGW-Zixibacteria-1]